MTAADYCAKMWTVATKHHQYRSKVDDYLFLVLPYYLIVGPNGMWEYGHATRQPVDVKYGTGYLLACMGKMQVPSWIQLV